MIASAEASRACPAERRLLSYVGSRIRRGFLPVYDISDAVASVVEADREVTWEALLPVAGVGMRCHLCNAQFERLKAAENHVDNDHVELMPADKTDAKELLKRLVP